MLKSIRITSKSVEDVIKIKFGDLHLMNPTNFPTLEDILSFS